MQKSSKSRCFFFFSGTTFSFLFFFVLISKPKLRPVDVTHGFFIISLLEGVSCTLLVGFGLSDDQLCSIHIRLGKQILPVFMLRFQLFYEETKRTRPILLFFLASIEETTIDATMLFRFTLYQTHFIITMASGNVDSLKMRIHALEVPSQSTKFLRHVEDER